MVSYPQFRAVLMGKMTTGQWMKLTNPFWDKAIYRFRNRDYNNYMTRQYIAEIQSLGALQGLVS
jgi:acetoacetate decarboxylase